MCFKNKSSWLATTSSPAHKFQVGAPFRDVAYGKVALPSPMFHGLVNHYVEVYRNKTVLHEPTVYPTTEIYVSFRHNTSGLRAFLIGPRSFPRAGEYATNDATYFVASLSFMGSYALAPIDQLQLLNQSFDLEGLFPGQIAELAQKIHNTADFQTKGAFFEKFYLRMLQSNRHLNTDAFRLINRLSALSTYEEYVQYVNSIGYTERHLRRLFLKYTGLSPVKFGRILRCQNAIRQLAANPASPLVEVALEAHFSDQAHFTRELKTFYDLTPLQFVKEFLE